MKKVRLIFFCAIMLSGFVFIALLIKEKPVTPLESSFAPAYQLFGHAAHGVSRALTQIMNVDSMDEKQYGDVIRQECFLYQNVKDPDYMYLNGVMKRVSQFSKKPFTYSVFTADYNEPNAWALPGGVIFVTKGLLSILSNESELAAILSHEMGHIELSHCLDAVRFEILSKKVGEKTTGEIADFAMQILVSYSFSKTQEGDADLYAFKLLCILDYDPAGEGKALRNLITWSESHGDRESQHADPVRDYFLTHPPLALRADKFENMARIWWKENPHAKRYVGVKNISKRLIDRFPEEWKGL